LLQLCRYILLNPVRAGLVRDPADFKWSTYRAMVVKDAIPEFLTTDWLLSLRNRFGMISAVNAFLVARNFCNGSWQSLRKKGKIHEIPRQQRYADQPPLSELLPASFPSKSDRNEAIVRS
jgi:hypothetical protein